VADSVTAPSRGLLDSLTRLAATLVAMTQTRLSLLALDVEEGRQQLLSLLALAFVAAMGVGLGVVLATVAVVMAFWDEQRIVLLGLMAGFFLICGLGACLRALHLARTQPKPFAASLKELGKDRQSLQRP
jgi:uncharacterized membrane protein YqjE